MCELAGRALVLGLVVVLCGVRAQAQDACSVEDVVQPAIDAAAEDNGCVADGVYLNAQVVLNVIEDRCFPDGQPVKRCRPCVSRVSQKLLPSLLALRKSDLLSPDVLDSVKEGVRELKANCESDDSNGDSGGGKGGDQQQGGGGTGEHNPPPSPSPSPTPGPGPNIDQLRNAVSSCHSFQECAPCVHEALSGMISQENVQLVFTQIVGSVCSN